MDGGATLRVNATFESYQELQEAVNRYEVANKVNFWKRDVKKIHRATPRIYEIVKNYPQLEYCSIRFSCIHGGQTFRPKYALGFPQSKKCKGTWKQDCKAEIFVGLNEDKNKLIVKKINDQHNHPIPSEAIYKQFPKNRRKVKVPKQNPVVHYQTKQNILQNLVKFNSLARSNNLKKVAAVLAEKYECTVDLQDDDQGKVVGFFFQDCQMRKCFEVFPEILLIDGTYKLQNIPCCVYVLSCENSLGTSDVVAVGVLTDEGKESVDWMIERFKDRNPNWKNVAIAITDRLTSHYKTVEEHFLNCRRLICLSHSVKLFKTETVASKLDMVTLSESNTFYEFFKKLIDSKTEEEYQVILEDMEDTVPYPLVQYFFEKWHDLRSEWVKGMTSSVRNCVATRFDGSNSKLKSAVSNCKTFKTFIESFFQILNAKRNEMNCSYGRVATKIQNFGTTEIEKTYCKYLTPYAFFKIKPNLNLSENDISEMSFEGPNEESDVLCTSEGFTHIVSEFSCNCDFFTLLKLPCKHLLAYRKLQNLSLFDKVLFSERWTRAFIQEMFVAEVGTSEREIPVDSTDMEVPTEDKLEKAQDVCVTLANLCVHKFEERMDLLEKLREVWEKGEEACVVRVVSEVEVGSSVVRDHDYVVKTEEG